jgi:hypothetical protein
MPAIGIKNPLTTSFGGGKARALQDSAGKAAAAARALGAAGKDTGVHREKAAHAVPGYRAHRRPRTRYTGAAHAAVHFGANRYVFDI